MKCFPCTRRAAIYNASVSSRVTAGMRVKFYINATALIKLSRSFCRRITVLIPRFASVLYVLSGMLGMPGLLITCDVY